MTSIFKRRTSFLHKHFVVANFEAYQDGELTEADRDFYRQHLAACQECQEWEFQHSGLIERLGTERRPRVVLPSAAAERIEQDLYHRLRRVAIMSNVRTALGAGAVVVIFVLILGTFFWWQSGDINTAAQPTVTAVPSQTALPGGAEQPTPTAVPSQTALPSGAEQPTPTSEPLLPTALPSPTATEPKPPFQAYEIGEELWGVAVADLNNDEHPDIAVADMASEMVRILFNQGDGTFQEVTQITTGDANSVDAADLDGDADLDLIVANGGRGTVSVLINNGDGTFSAPMDYAAGVEPNWAFAEDLNGDSAPDLVVPQEFADVGIFLNRGDGTFEEVQWFFTGSRGRGVSASAGDMNGDGYPDLAVRHYPDPVVSILFNDGQGSFTDPEEYEVLHGPRWITTADLNGDHFDDVIVPSQSGAVSVLFNKGDGSFQDRIDIEVGGDPHYTNVLDMDGDLLPDILVAPTGSGMVSVLSNRGDGSFELTKDYYYHGAWAYIFVVTDVDGDDRLDLVTTSLDSAIFVIPGENDG